MEAFIVSAVVVAVGEIGDKTQLATVALAARFDSLPAVVAGTTTGMLIADAPAVFFGEKASLRLPFKTVRYVAAALFAAIGIAAVAGLRVPW
ncbi:MAG: TMEM165/GDT1 family protein [Betaproteobacteria bacterium]|nr:TMEM165/GDT1 family protein [Betaproteobacteria bacterium]